MENQKLQMRTKKVVAVIAALMFVVSVVLGVVLNVSRFERVSDEPLPTFDAEILSISKYNENGELIAEKILSGDEQNEQQEEKSVDSIAGKGTLKLEAGTEEYEYINKKDTLKLYLNGIDDEAYASNSLTTNDISVYVNNQIQNGVTKELSVVSESAAEGVKYLLTLSNVTGNGQLSVIIAANTLENSVGNKNAQASQAVFVDSSNSNLDKIIMVDNVVPTVQIAANTSSPTNANSITYTFTFSENVYDFDANDITVTNGTKGTFSGSGSSYSLVVTNSGSGTQSVSVVAGVCRDIGYNKNTASNVVNMQIDRNAPVISLSLSTNNYASSVDVNVSATDADSTIAGLKWASGNRDVSYFASNGSNVENNKFTVTSNGTYTVYAADALGNATVATIDVTKIDRTDPTIVCNNSVNGDGFSFTLKDIAPDSTEAPSGILGYKITESNTAPTSGWSTVASQSETTVDGKKQKSITINLTNTHLVAGTHYIWAIDGAGHTNSKQITITYNLTLNPGDNVTSTGTTSVTTTGPILQNITPPTKTGYTFGGYYTATNGGGTKYYNADGTPAHSNDILTNTTLYAKWTANSYKVVFHKNAESATGTMSDQNFAYGVAQNLTENAFEWEGLHFKEWRTNADGSGTAFSDEEEVINLTDVNNGTVNLYAIWEGEGLVMDSPQYRSVTYSTNSQNVTFNGVSGGTGNYAYTEVSEKNSSNISTNYLTLDETTPTKINIAANTPAGIYELEVHVRDTLSNVDIENNPKIYVTVNKAKITIPSSPAVKTYNRNVQQCGITTPANTAVVTGSVVSATNAGTYTVTYRLNDTTNYEWSTNVTADKLSDKSINWVINPYSISGGNSSIAAIPNQTYTGSAITPNPTVTALETTLVKDADYTVEYTNNTNTGTASATITGTNNYTGTKVVNFTIAKEENNITVNPVLGLVYNTTAQNLVTPSNLEVDVYYSLTGEVNAGNISNDKKTIPTGTNAGTYTVYWYVPESNNYLENSGSVEVTISPFDISGGTIADIASQNYSGSTFTPTPAVSVTINGATRNLAAPSEFTYSYSNNTNPTNIAVVTATGTVNYTGSLSKHFTINPCITFHANGGTGTMAPQHMPYDVETQLNANTYTRSNLHFDVWNNQEDGNGSRNYSDQANIKITENIDLYAQWEGGDVVFPSQTINVTYSTSSQNVTFEGASGGTGNYSYVEVSEYNSSNENTNYLTLDGTTITIAANTPSEIYYCRVRVTDTVSNKQKNSTIIINVNKASITIPSSPSAKTYNGSEQLCDISRPANTTVVAGSTRATNAGTYTVTFALSNSANYQWSDGTTADKDVTWVINPYDISGENSSVAAIPNQTFNGSECKPNPTVTVPLPQSSSTTLVKNTDYTLEYSNNTNAGTASVTITGTGNYTGSKSANFTIGLAPNPLEVNAIPGLVYNTTAQTLVTPSNPQGDVYYSLDGALNAGNISNDKKTIPTRTDAGTYTVYWYTPGNANYAEKSGETNVTISPFDISGASIGSVPAQNYTGSAITPAPIVSITINGASRTLRNPEEFTYSYSNNTNPTNAAVITANGTRNYTGSESSYFIINPLVTFDANGGTGTMTSQHVTYNSFTKLNANAFTNVGYNFAGWNLMADGSGSYYNDQANIKTMLNVTLYAQWTEKTYTLTIKPNGGTIDGASTDIVRTLKYSDVSDISTPVQSGYTFSGYSELSGAVFPDGLSGTAAYASTGISAISVTTRAKSGDNPLSGATGELRVTNSGSTATSPGLGGFYKATTPTANHSYVHIFVAKLDAGKYFHFAHNSLGTGGSAEWLTSNKGTGTWRTYVYKVNFGTGSVGTFGCVYVSANQNNVWNGNNTASETGTFIADFAYSNIIDITSNDTGIGQIDGDAVLTASYNANQYTVTANPNGGTINSGNGWTAAGDNLTATKQVTYNGSYGTLPSASQVSWLGHNFAGWYTAPTGGTQVTASTIMSTAGSSTIYAHWTPIEYYVHFESNGGTGTMDNQHFYYYDDETLTELTANAFTKSGYSFSCWKDANNKTYSNKEPVTNLASTDGAIITLTAQWSELSLSESVIYLSKVSGYNTAMIAPTGTSGATITYTLDPNPGLIFESQDTTVATVATDGTNKKGTVTIAANAANGATTKIIIKDRTTNEKLGEVTVIIDTAPPTWTVRLNNIT